MPRSFGDFEISETLLGRGGMASVYLGRQISLDVPRAIKILHPAFADDRDFISRFEREARHGAAISHHPNIVGVVSYGNADGRYYIVMELVEGTDLKSVLEEHAPLPPEIALLLLEEVAKGLEAAHRIDIWHRDVKPSNVLVRRTGEVQIADFGLARNNRDRERLAQDARTMPGTVMGTLAYMSPEQHQGWDDNRIDHRTDIFSLGVMAYELLTGNRPFRGTESEVREQAMNADPEPVAAGCPLATPAIEAMVTRMLAKKREDRCGSMGEALVLIREAMKSLDPDEDILKYRQEYLREFVADAREFCERLNRANIAKNLALGDRLLGESPPRTDAAITAYSRVLLLDPGNREAEAALAGLRGESEASRLTIDRTFPNREWKGAGRELAGGPGAAARRRWRRTGIGAVSVLGLAAAAYFIAGRTGGGGTGDAAVPVSLNVRSNPDGAEVFLRAPEAVSWPAPAGTTNTTVQVAGVGDWEFRLSREGYRDTVFTLAVSESPSLLALTLVPDTVGAPPEVVPREPAEGARTAGTSAGDPARPPAKTPAEPPPSTSDPAVEGGLDATISVRVLTPADIYIDGELWGSRGTRGRVSVPVSSGRDHTLELRTPEGSKTFSGLRPSPFGLMDLRTWEMMDSSWVESDR